MSIHLFSIGNRFRNSTSSLTASFSSAATALQVRTQKATEKTFHFLKTSSLKAKAAYACIGGIGSIFLFQHRVHGTGESKSDAHLFSAKKEPITTKEQGQDSQEDSIVLSPITQEKLVSSLLQENENHTSSLLNDTDYQQKRWDRAVDDFWQNASQGLILGGLAKVFVGMTSVARIGGMPAGDFSPIRQARAIADCASPFVGRMVRAVSPAAGQMLRIAGGASPEAVQPAELFA